MKLQPNKLMKLTESQLTDFLIKAVDELNNIGNPIGLRIARQINGVLDPELKLKPLSKYIVDKHFANGKKINSFYATYPAWYEASIRILKAADLITQNKRDFSLRFLVEVMFKHYHFALGIEPDEVAPILEFILYDAGYLKLPKVTGKKNRYIHYSLVKGSKNK